MVRLLAFLASWLAFFSIKEEDLAVSFSLYSSTMRCLHLSLTILLLFHGLIAFSAADQSNNNNNEGDANSVIDRNQPILVWAIENGATFYHHVDIDDMMYGIVAKQDIQIPSNRKYVLHLDDDELASINQ